jgi:FG-GAP repeat
MRSALCACLSIGALLGLIVAAAASAAPPPSDGVVDLLTAANAEIVGPSANARTRTVGGGGDVNGDGLADVLVGSPEVGPTGRPRAGWVWVLAGRTQPADVDLAAPGPLALARMDGAAPFDELARFSVAVAGDVNGDGAADILMGAPGADNNGRVGSGSAYVIFGGAGLSDVDLAALGASGARIDGAAPGESAGWRVAPAGDVNLDGVADILVDTQRGTGQPSVVYVVFGGVGFASLDLARAGAARAIRIVRQRGTSAVGGADGAGDVNGDGFSDLIVDDTAVPRDQAFVVFGSATPSDVNLAAPAGRAIRILGRPDEEIGFVAGAGDVNGDGFDDVAVGAPFGPGAQGGASGAVDVIRGGARLTDIDLASAGNRATRFLPGVGGLLGSRITGVGDVDGNGVDDLAVGALSANFPSRGTAGSVMVLLGGPRFFRSATRTAAPGGGDILRLVGPLARASAGDVGRAGDVDRDGRADIVVAGGNASLKDRALAGGAWLYGYGATRRCAAVPRPGGRPVEESADPIRLTRQQLLINQRIGQAAIRRIAAVEQRLADGLQDRDVCGGTISAQSLVSTLTPSYGAEIPMPRPAPQPITTVPPSGEPGNVRLTAQQLLINQRIYQAALLRSRSLAGRLNGRITGGDLDAGTITRGRFTPGLTLTAAGAVTSLPPTGSEARTAERRSGGRVTLSATQLRINQRIAQVGVRTANDAISQIERGLINGNFADRSIGSEVLAPGVVSSR